jgi:hypothetical protein
MQERRRKMENLAFVLVMVILDIIFPIGAAYYAYRRGRKGWATVSIGSIFLGLGLFGGAFALLAARRPLEKPDSQQVSDADRIRSKGRILAPLAGVGTTLVVAMVMILVVALPMIDSAKERSLSNPTTSAAEVIAEVDNASNSATAITGFVSLGVGLAVFFWVRQLVNKHADAAEAAAHSASKQSKEQLEKG